MESNNNHIQGISAIGQSAINNSSHILLDDGYKLIILYKGPGLNFICLCRQIFNTCPALERHLSGCTSLRSPESPNISDFRCNLCMETLSSVAKISAHYKKCKTLSVRLEPSTSAGHSSHDTANMGAFPCKYCARHFETAIGRGQHAKKAHGTELIKDAKFKRKVCNNPNYWPSA